MNRRQFVRGLVAGVATVIVGMKLANKMPDVPDPKWIGIDWGQEPSQFIRWQYLYGFGPILKDTGVIAMPVTAA